MTVFIASDYSKQFRPNRVTAEEMATLLMEFFNERNLDTTIIPVPDEFRSDITSISVFRQAIGNDPTLNDERELLIVFGA